MPVVCAATPRCGAITASGPLARGRCPLRRGSSPLPSGLSTATGRFTQQPGAVLKGEITGVDPDPGEIGGTYHMEANCAGSLLLHAPGLPFPVEYRFVAVDNAKEVMATVMSPAGNLVTVELVRQ